MWKKQRIFVRVFKEVKVDPRKLARAQRDVRKLWEEGKFRPSVVAIIEDTRGYFYVFQSARHPPTWSFIQGGVKQCEDILDALAREIIEESGLWFGYITVTDLVHRGRLRIPKGKVEKFTEGKAYFFFHVKIPQGRRILLQKEETLAYKKVRREELPAVFASLYHEKRDLLLKAVSKLS